MIPKVIHYCWFGNSKKPRLAKRCIQSWKRLCPDYRIIEWNENNFDLSKACPYVQEAYESEKWAFVTDYVRLWVFYHFGGIYLDTDVELIKPLDDLTVHPAFFGYQDRSLIATGLGCGAEKGNPLVKAIMDDYKDIHFVDVEGNLDLTPCTVRNTELIRSRYGSNLDASIIQITDDAVFYPKEYFSPIDCKTMIMEKSEKAYSIHWFAASWTGKDSWIEREYFEFYKKVSGVLGARATYLFVTVFYSIFRYRELKHLKDKWKKQAKY